MKVTKYKGLSKAPDIITFDMHKYDGLEMSEGFKELASTPEGIQKIIGWCNGVGSEVGFWANLMYHIVPNTIWFLDVTAVSDIHDVDYWYPTHFKSKALALKFKSEADLRLKNNFDTYIKMHTTNKILLRMRLNRSEVYYKAVSMGGELSFLEGKTFDE